MIWKQMMEKNTGDTFYEEGMNKGCADTRPSRFLNGKEAAQHLSDPRCAI